MSKKPGSLSRSKSRKNLSLVSWVEKPSEQFIAEQTGTLVELMIKGVAATNIETFRSI